MPMSSSVTEKETACLTLKANDEHEVDSQGWWSSLLSSVTQEKLHSSPTNPWKLGTPAPLFQHYIPCCFTILHYHNKRDKGKNSYKVQGLNPHSRMGFTKLREKAGKAKEEQIPKFFSSFPAFPNHVPKEVMDASWVFAWKCLLTQSCISVTCWSTSTEGCIHLLSKNNWITNPKYLYL